ncbi:MAG: ATP-binding cassette domain-containing protein [Clostridiaceae bacterium]|jgi:D-methionine transport system ATP-binding protein|nr:ATP-binding cassette domain-containing protein [Clostridiaceae bacterium]
MSEAAIIRIENLNKTFGNGGNAVVALDDINLSVKQGEVFGIIGLSGAGKSTLVRCINLLEKPTTGNVIFDGKDITLLSDRELRDVRQSIGMIFQGFNLLMQRTALENICFPLELAGVSRKEAKQRAREMLNTVGLAEKENAYPAQLSGGQKQRVAIARALATRPKVLLCDEATSALDPTTTQSILSLLKDLNKKLGLTVIIITHEMKVIEQICNRVAIIDNSHIEEIGTVDDVFRHPKTQAAKKLIFPRGEMTKSIAKGGKYLRIVFDGNSSDQPVIANMVLECGEPVNIVFANTKDIDGKAYGHMIIQIPDDPVIYHKITLYLDLEKITYAEENYDV